MGRRGGSWRCECQHDGCTESRHVAYDTLRELGEIRSSNYYRNWRCERHANPERYLTPDNPANQAVLVATDGYYTNHRGEQQWTGRYWYPEGKTTGSGINFSDAHYVDAKNFPAGTRLVITAYTETPEQAAVASALGACSDARAAGGIG